MSDDTAVYCQKCGRARAVNGGLVSGPLTSCVCGGSAFAYRRPAYEKIFPWSLSLSDKRFLKSLRIAVS